MPLNQIEVKLIDHMGSDLSVVNAARQSFGITSQSFTEKEYGILNRLMKDKHASPFEAATLTYQVKAPIRVAREHMRHRTASYSEYSLRYAPFINEFFIWTVEDIRAQQGKAMDYTFVKMEETTAQAIADLLNAQAQSDLDVYQTILGLGAAREIASYCLPLDSMTLYSVTTNLRNALNFLHLRTSEAALREIRWVANILERELRKTYPQTLALWDLHGRQQL